MLLGRTKPTRALFLRRRTLCECDYTVQHLHPERQFPVIAYQYTALHCCDLDQPPFLAAPAPTIATPHPPDSVLHEQLCPDRPLSVFALNPTLWNALSCHTPHTLESILQQL